MTDDEISMRGLIKSPLTWMASVLSVGLYDPTILYGFAQATWMNLGSLFTLTSIAGLTLPKYWPPASKAEWAIVLVGVGFAGKIGLEIYRSYDQEL
jgi:hypothetical protein